MVCITPKVDCHQHQRSRPPQYLLIEPKYYSQKLNHANDLGNDETGVITTNSSRRFLGSVVVADSLLNNRLSQWYFYRVPLVNCCWGQLRLDLRLDHSHMI